MTTASRRWPMAYWSEIVPSSARSTASAAAPLPAHLLPLMSTSLAKLKSVVDNALPSKRNATALEEAEFEEDEGDSFAKHSMLQCESTFPVE